MPIDKYYLSSVTLSLEDAATRPHASLADFAFPSLSSCDLRSIISSSMTRKANTIPLADASVGICFRTNPNEVEEVAAHDHATKLIMIHASTLTFERRTDSHVFTYELTETSHSHNSLRRESLSPLDPLITAAGGCNSSTGCNRSENREQTASFGAYSGSVCGKWDNVKCRWHAIVSSAGSKVSRSVACSR